MTTQTTFAVHRYDPDADRHWVHEYTFELRHGMTVLEGLWHIVRHIDGSLCFRYSCRGAVCGSCAMQINDTIRLACNTQIGELDSDTVTIRPLPRMALLRDLIVDIESLFEHLRSIQPALVHDPDHEREILQSPDERRQINDSVKCILCASCHAACPLTSFDGNYLGPAVLSAAHRFAFDTRNDDADAMLERVNNIDGGLGCRTISRCTQVCPKGVDPSIRIKELKQRIRVYANEGRLGKEDSQ